MSRECIYLERYLHIVEKLTSFFHNGQVTCAAHDNTYNWRHFIFTIYNFEPFEQRRRRIELLNLERSHSDT